MEKSTSIQRGPRAFLSRIFGLLKRFFCRTGQFIKRHKAFSALAVLAVAAAGFWGSRALFTQPTQTPAGSNIVRTTTLQRTSLEDAISATGTVESGSVSNVTTSLKYTVREVPVQVGDTVSEGDIICVLDTSELEDQIEKAKESLSETAEQAQSNYDQALASFQTASDEAAQAEAAYASAQTAYNAALTNFQNAQSTVSALQDAYDAAQAKADAAAAAVAEKLNAYTAAKAAGTGVEEALAALNAANQTYEGCDWGGVGTGGLKAEAEAALSALNSGKSLCGYNELEQALNTALNATVGSAVTDSVVATIQDTNALNVAITVEEYDIASLEVGLPVIITSDVTGETEINGTLTQISRTASSSQMGSSSGGFACEVTVDDADTGLLIGVSAKVEIYLSVTEDVFTVPIDAVGTDEEGNSVVYVRSGEGVDAEFEPVVVTTGAENDYYIEISSDKLEEGMIVRASANAEEATIGSSGEEDVASDASGTNFSFGGMAGIAGVGEAPSGGEMPSGGMGGGRMGG